MADLKVFERTSVSDKQFKSRATVRALRAGHDAMRADRKYLPQRPAESAAAYAWRRDSSFLFPGFEDTIEDLVARPFRKPARITEKVPEAIRTLFSVDADLEETSISNFAREVFREGVYTGLCHILVDFTKKTERGTVESDQAMGVRPYFVRVSDDQILGYREGVVGGKRQLTQVRIYEESYEEQGPWDVVLAPRVRILNLIEFEEQNADGTPGNRSATVTWELWHPDPSTPATSKKWVLYDGGVLEGPDYIPLFTFYTDREGLMAAKPPLQKLADKNVQLFQNESMQQNCLDFARSVIYFGAGFTEEERSGKLKLGRDQAMFSSNADASLQVVETQGSALGAGRQHALDIKEEMVLLGLKPLIEAGQQTATGRAIDDDRAMTVAEQWVRDLQDIMSCALRAAGDYLGQELPDRGLFEVSEDFGINAVQRENVVALVEARKNKDISREDFLTELKRYGVLAPSYNPEKGAADAEAEEAAQMKAMLAAAGPAPSFGGPPA